MAMGRRKAKQKSLFVEAERMPTGPRHRFYDALNKLLDEAGFDTHVESLCALAFEPSSRGGRPSVPPGVYFRMLLLGYFEGIESERGICWRCEDSLSLKRFLGYEPHEPTPDHSTLSRMRTRLSERTYEEVFRFVMRVLNEQGLTQGKVAGVDATYLRADASMKTIVRKGSGEGYKGYLRKLAKEAGIEQPTDEELRRLDRKRKGKKTSNQEWESPTDPDAEIVRLKDGSVLVCVYTCARQEPHHDEFRRSPVGRAIERLPSSRRIFVYADPDLPKPSLEEDVLRLDTEESYANLAMKTYLMVKHCVEALRFDHLVKIDVTSGIERFNRDERVRNRVGDPDEMVRFIDRLSGDLGAGRAGDYDGWRLVRAKRRGIERWARVKGLEIDLDRVFPDDRIPPYYSGKCYCLSRRLAEFVAAHGEGVAREHVRHLSGSEDVLVGRLYDAFKAQRAEEKQT